MSKVVCRARHQLNRVIVRNLPALDHTSKWPVLPRGSEKPSPRHSYVYARQKADRDIYPKVPYTIQGKYAVRDVAPIASTTEDLRYSVRIQTRPQDQYKLHPIKDVELPEAEDDGYANTVELFDYRRTTANDWRGALCACGRILNMATFSTVF